MILSVLIFINIVSLDVCAKYILSKKKLLLFIILTRFTRCNMQGVARNHCGVIVTVLSNRKQGAGVRGISGYVRCAVFRFSLEGHKRKFYTRVQLVSRLFSDRKCNNHNTTIVAHSRSRLPVQFSSLRGVYAPFIVLFLSYGLQTFVSLLSSTLLTCIQWVADETNKNTIYRAHC